jgi:hypothetical protein
MRGGPFYAFYAAFYAWWIYFPQSGALAEGIYAFYAFYAWWYIEQLLKMAVTVTVTSERLGLGGRYWPGHQGRTPKRGPITYVAADP